MRQNQKGFSAVEFVLLFVVVALVGFSGWYVWHSNENSSKKRSSANVISPNNTSITTHKSGAACQSSQLSLSVDKYLGPVAQQPGAYFKFTNTSNTSCTLDGYPTFSAYSSSNAQITGKTTNGSSYQISDPKASSVALNPGASAYFGVGWTDANQEYGGSTTGCIEPSAVKVLPPGNSQALSAPVNNFAVVCPTSSWNFSITAIGTIHSFGNPSAP